LLKGTKNRDGFFEALCVRTEAHKYTGSKNNTLKKESFKSVFRLHFYENNEGVPGGEITEKEIRFIKRGKGLEKLIFDISEYEVYFPETGVFVEIEIVGQLDENDNYIQQTKKLTRVIQGKKYTYRESIESDFLFTTKVDDMIIYKKNVLHFKEKGWRLNETHSSGPFEGKSLNLMLVL